MSTLLTLHAPVQAHASKAWKGNFRLVKDLHFSPFVQEGEAAGSEASAAHFRRFIHVQVAPDTLMSTAGDAVSGFTTVKTLNDIANTQVYPWDEHRAMLPVSWVWNQAGKWLPVGADTLLLQQRKLRWLYFSLTDLQRASLAVWLDEMLSQGTLAP